LFDQYRNKVDDDDGQALRNALCGDFDNKSIGNQIYQLITTLRCVQEPGDSIKTWLAKLRNNFIRLKDLGFPTHDKLLLGLIVFNIDPRYSDFVDNLLVDSELELSKLQQSLVEMKGRKESKEETGVKKTNGKLFRCEKCDGKHHTRHCRMRSLVTCPHCKKIGHNESSCWQKYPHLKDKKRGKGKGNKVKKQQKKQQYLFSRLKFDSEENRKSCMSVFTNNSQKKSKSLPIILDSGTDDHYFNVAEMGSIRKCQEPSRVLGAMKIWPVFLKCVRKVTKF